MRGLHKLLYSNTLGAFRLIHAPLPSHGWVATEATLPWLAEGRGQLTCDSSLDDRQEDSRKYNQCPHFRPVLIQTFKIVFYQSK